jgi:2-polyprenyl-3-methyl-5-hydroxy-6-metoxy-1,4-benzoquinol methylase
VSSFPSPRPPVAPASIEHADVETSSEAYARRFTGPVGAWFLATQEAATVRMLAPYRGASILDVGGGHGQVTEALVAHGYRVTVLGSAPSCRQRIERFVSTGACAFDVGSLLDLPYRGRSYDVVLSYRLLPHVADGSRLLRELARVADRAVLIDVPSRHSLNCLAPWLFEVKKRIEGNTRSFALFDERAVVAVAASTGFAAADRHAQFFLPMALHRLLGAPRFSSAAECVLRVVGATERFGSPVIMKFVRRHR